MMSKINFRVGAAAMVASLFFYSCSQEEEKPVEEAVFTELDGNFDSQVIPGQYIVVYRKGSVEDTGSKYPKNYSKAQEAMAEQTKMILSKASIKGAEIVNVYSSTVMGATMKLSEKQVQELRGLKEIAYVEQDRIVMFAPPCGTPKGGPCHPILTPRNPVMVGLQLRKRLMG